MTRVKEEKKISPLINVIIVTRWDILLRIVQLEEKNTRREITKDTMPNVVEDDEPPTKMIKEKNEDYVLFSALSGSMSLGEDTWIIDSGSSKNMIGQRDILSSFIEKNFPQKFTLGDDYQYPIKGVGESTYKLDSRIPMKMKDVLYVPGLTKNLTSISILDNKGFRFAFIDGEVIM